MSSLSGETSPTGFGTPAGPDFTPYTPSLVPGTIPLTTPSETTTPAYDDVLQSVDASLAIEPITLPDTPTDRPDRSTKLYRQILGWTTFIATSVTAFSTATTIASGVLMNEANNRLTEASMTLNDLHMTTTAFAGERDDAFAAAVQRAVADNKRGRETSCATALQELQFQTDASNLNTSALMPSQTPNELVDTFTADKPCGKESEAMAKHLVSISFAAADAALVDLEQQDLVIKLWQDTEEYRTLLSASRQVAGISSFITLGCAVAQLARVMPPAKPSYRPKRRAL